MTSIDSSGKSPNSINFPPRQMQTLGLLLEGKSEKEVAWVMQISPRTVHRYVTLIYRRTGVHSRSELLVKCLGGQFRLERNISGSQTSAPDSAEFLACAQERRRFPRITFDETVMARVQPLHQIPFKARIRDVSRRGIGLLSSRRLEVGKQFLLSINFPSGIMKMQCSTARCMRAGNNNQFIIGAKILTVDSEEHREVKLDTQHVEEVRKRLEAIVGTDLKE